MTDSDAPGASQTQLEGGTPTAFSSPSTEPQDGSTGYFTPIPSQIAAKRNPTILPLVPDERATARLLERILESAGLSVAECARRLGVSDSSLRQYLLGKRSNPSLMMFLKICAVAGAKAHVELT
jgi:DNA-binding XRE family transcriptional regulator